MRIATLCGLALFPALSALGQEFDVVSIKPNQSNVAESDVVTGGRFTAINISLQALLARAYGLPQNQIVGPGWLDAVRFDVVAKLPEGFHPSRANSSDIQAMQRNMLAGRFKMEAHKDTRMVSAYALAVDKKGIKLKEAREGCSASRNNNPGLFIGTCVNMKLFAEFVSWYADLPVVDMTGLTGSYDIKLVWVPERGRPAPGADAGYSLVGTTMDIALQEQLGLKLERRKAPIDVVVVDRIERTPTEN
jgi:uncharacterized protein (TIGR03435 family)